MKSIMLVRPSSQNNDTFVFSGHFTRTQKVVGMEVFSDESARDGD